MKMTSPPLGIQFRSIRAMRFGALLVAVIAVAGQARAQPLAIPTVAVQPKSLGAKVELDGVIEAVRQSVVSAQASGLIASLSVKAGDKVKAGQLLAVIDDRESVASAQRSQAQVNQADAELRNAKANWQRTQDLQTKGFVSKAALDSADAQYKSASAVRDQALAVSRQTSISQSFTRVNAPYDGWVLQTHAQAGDLAVPGKPLVTVYAPQPLRAVVQVPASRGPTVKSAVQTAILVDNGQNKTLSITPLSRTAVPSADPVSQTTEWRFDLPTKDVINLVPGQQVHVQFLEAQAGKVEKLTVPVAAIVRRGELTAVYVATGQTFSLRAVRLGSQQATDSVEVFAGLLAGEVIALDPIRAGFANAQPATPQK
jgi:RND family efflux transporter MFP subunit